MGLIYLMGKCADNRVRVFHRPSEPSFSGGKILGNKGRGIYKRKEQIFVKRFEKIEMKFKNLDQKFDNITESLANIKNTLKDNPSKKDIRNKISQNENPFHQKDIHKGNRPSKGKNSKNQTNNINKNEVTFNASPNNITTSKVIPEKINNMKTMGFGARRKLKKTHGPSILSFPVQSKEKQNEMTIKIPSGSFVKAKLLTGVEAPEGKALPVLLQADYAFIGPNKSRIDLTGCFLIAKSSGNLSIERVEMQVTKISCVSKSGRMFDKKINGFVADAKDNSFAVRGDLNSKQNRVAAMAFLSSVVEGVGKSLQQVQTTTQTHATGVTTSLISGQHGKYIAAGGVGNAASQVTQWYLKHAQNLLPTINVGSGKDVWLVIQDTVDLPNWYFRKEKKKSQNKGFTYLSRFLDN